jgi:Animal haem peroxidase
MEALGKRMEANKGTFTPAHNVTMLPAGYTYFGQFVDHDITRDDTYLWDAGTRPPDQTPNLAGQRLDLSQLYGDGPGSGKHGGLYNGDNFRLGDPVPGGEAFDVPLDPKTKEPALADDRDTENAIIRQVHALFLKLHNVAVAEIGVGSGTFAAARQKVTWQYQWLIRNDYLREICNPTAYAEIIEKEQRRVDWGKEFSIPVEFAQAAFRFGHSMVRDVYRLNPHPNVPLSRLFSEAHQPKNLPPELAITWTQFLDAGPTTETAMAIDTTMVPALFHLPDEHFHHLISDVALEQPPQLSVRTLRRGAATGLPTGEEVCCALGREQLRGSRELTTKTDPWVLLDELSLRGRTPLWYYILIEAEQQEDGRRLGYIGSWIIAETIDAALRADADSYLNNGVKNWTPPEWNVQGTSIPIRHLKDIPKVVGL